MDAALHALQQVDEMTLLEEMEMVRDMMPYVDWNSFFCDDDVCTHDYRIGISGLCTEQTYIVTWRRLLHWKMNSNLVSKHFVMKSPSLPSIWTIFCNGHLMHEQLRKSTFLNDFLPNTFV